MSDPLSLAIAGLAAAVALLIVVIIAGRALRNRRDHRARELRPLIEEQVAEYVISENPAAAVRPASRFERELMMLVALEALGELRGAERERVTSLLEETGLVDDAAAALFSSLGRVRRKAAETLMEVRSSKPVVELIAGLVGHDEEVRLACAGALAELGSEQYLSSVLNVADELADSRPGAVAGVLLTLGRRVPASLAAALEETRTPQMRRLAAAVISELRLADHAPLLLTALAGPDDELVARAARGLGEIGDFEVVGPLVALVEDDEREWFVRLSAAGALGAIGSPEAAPALERAIQSTNWSLRAKAAEALDHLGDSGKQSLQRALASPREDVREQAAAVLGR